MSTEYPIIDALAWARWLSAFAAIIVLPGWALIGRHLRGLDPLSRFYVATGAGLLSSTLCGLAFSVIAFPLDPWSFLLVNLGAAWLLGRRAWWRAAIVELTGGMEPLDHRESLAAVGLCVVMGVIVVAAFRAYAAPNHIDDATNHSFMVWRILETRSISAARVFAPPYGAPPVPYLMGWHGGAALLARAAGVPAYVGTWYLPVLAAVFTPLALSLYWRSAGVDRNAVLLGGGFAVANYYTPNNIFSWGGFGAILGLFLIPWMVLGMRALWRRPSAAGALVAALAFVALLHIHTGDLLTVLVLLLATRLGAGTGIFPRRRRILSILLAAGTFVLLGVLPLLAMFSTYLAWTGSEALPAKPGFAAIATQLLTFAGGNVPSLHYFVVPGLIAGLLIRRLRRLAALALAFAILYFGLRQVQDPVSLLLTKPYYRQYPRLVYPLVFLLPPLMAAAVLWLMARMRTAWGSRPGRRLPELLLLLALIHFVLYPGAYWNYRNLEYQRRGVPFSAADAAQARATATELPPGAVVANQYGDGSYWAMHVSGLRFLDPCSWPLGAREGLHHRPAIARLLERPWPPEARALRELGAEYVYVGDSVQESVQPPLRRDRLDADARFQRLLDNGNAAVYRILWDAEPAP